jgi:hypothetical protein
MRKTFGLLLALSVVTACGDKGGAAPSGSGSAAAAASGSAKPAAGGKGLAAAGNNADVVALAKKAIACKYDTQWDYDCADFKAWSDAKILEDGAQDATLVNMLEDPDDKVRSIAALGLNSKGDKYRTDKDMAGRVIAAAQSEKSDKVDIEQLGAAVGAIKVKPTGTWDRVKKLLETGPDKLKKGILEMVNFSNNDDDAVFDYVSGLTKDANPIVKHQALSAFWNIGNRRIDDKCKIYQANLASTDDAMSGLAAMGISQCLEKSDKVDALLDELDRRIKAAAPLPAEFGNSIAFILDPTSKVNDAERKRTVKSALSFLACAKCGTEPKSRFLDRLLVADPAKAKPVLTKLEKDKDTALAKDAKDALDKKK